MKYLVTGGNGYIGSQLVEELLKKGHEVSVLYRAGSYPHHVKNEILDQVTSYYYDGTAESLDSVVENIDAVFHLAALYNTRDDSDTVNKLVESNIIYSTHLLQKLSERNPQATFVSTSTFSAYDKNGEYHPATVYAATKKAVEVLAASFKVRSVFLTLPDTYGPNDWRVKVHNLASNTLKNGDTFSFNSPADQKINLLHVRDVIRGLLKASELAATLELGSTRTYELFHPVNTITLSELAEALVSHYKKGALEFPLFGKIVEIPEGKNFLPGFTLTAHPICDLPETLS